MLQLGIGIIFRFNDTWKNLIMESAEFKVGMGKTGPLFVSTPAIRDTIERKDLEIDHDVGGIRFQIQGKTAIIGSYRPLDPNIYIQPHKSTLPVGQGLASLLELRTLLEFQKRHSEIRYIQLDDEISPTYQRQLGKRGLFVWKSRRMTIEKFIKALRWKVANDAFIKNPVVGKYSIQNRTIKRKNKIVKSIAGRKVRWWKRKG